MKRLIEIIIEKKIIEILLENNYKIHVLSEDLVEINTKELLSNNNLLSIYLIYKNETIILLGKDFYIEGINEFNIIENLKKNNKFILNIKLCYNNGMEQNSNYYEGKIDNKLYYPYVNGSVMLKQLE